MFLKIPIIRNNYNVFILSLREIKRFFKVYNQTIISPVISTLIFLAIFSLAFGENKPTINGIKFIDFIGYGLIIMSILQNSFANSSSSLIMSKILGYIIDIILSPFSGKQIIISYIIGSIARSFLVGIVVTLCLAPFIVLKLLHPVLLIIILLNGIIFMSLLGILSGLMTKTFDQNSTVNNYIIIPLSFLSGTFYSMKSLPLFLQKVNLINPIFYIIDGFRFCFTNIHDSNILYGLLFIFFINIILFILLAKMFDVGWGIRD